MSEREVKLLPTPVAGDGREKGGGGRWNEDSAPLEQTIKDELLALSSGPCSPGSGCSTSDSRSPASSTAGSASGTSGGEGSSGSGGPMPESLTMFDTSELERSSGSTGSLGASRARESARPGSGTGSITPKPFCGERCGEPLASFDRDTSSWRTSQTSLLSTTGPCGEKFSGTWPRSGMTSAGTVFPLQPSAPLTDVTGFSPLLSTPTRADGQKGPGSRRGLAAVASGAGRSLTEEVALLPTPCARDWKGEGYKGQLPTELRLLPTPNASLANYSEEPEAWARRPKHVRDKARSVKADGTVGDSSLPLPVAIKREALRSTGASTSQRSDAGSRSSGLRLSPWFVEWMIGAPPGWSDPDCPLSAMEFKCRLEGSSGST